MAREPLQELTPAKLQLIRQRLNSRPDLSQAGLARAANVDPSTISRILQGARRATVRALHGIALALEIDPSLLVDQYELELEIDEQFIAAATEALAEELSHLREVVGRVRARALTGVVGVHFHGLPPEKRVYEREFRMPSRRLAKRGSN